MTSASVDRPLGTMATGFPMSFLWQEYKHILNSLLVKIILGFLIYALLGVPFITQKPPEYVVKNVSSFFGQSDFLLKLFLFVWTDLAMNKLAVFCGIVLAGGIISDERARRSLGVFLSKPIQVETYYLVRVIAAMMVFVTLYILVTLVGLLYFPFVVKGFSVSQYLAMSVPHMFAAMFCVSFSGLVALFFQRKITSMLISMAVLFSLVSTAFIGFYNPAWKWVGYLNPFYYGVQMIAKLGSFGAMDIIFPVLVLLVFNGVMLGLGAWKASQIQDLD